jgi:hypothetical protein
MRQYEIRFRHFKRGRRSERTIKIDANTQAGAKKKFLQSLPWGSLAHIISIFPVKVGDPIAQAQA